MFAPVLSASGLLLIHENSKPLVSQPWIWDVKWSSGLFFFNLHFTSTFNIRGHNKHMCLQKVFFSHVATYNLGSGVTVFVGFVINPSERDKRLASR